jgi:glycosyltransferase involved in cell wall biosynthesis
VVYDGIASASQFDERRLEAARAALARPANGAFTFIVVGLLQPAKGQQTAIRALHLLRARGLEARLVVVGSGHDNYVQSCQSLCAELGVSDVVSFRGYVENPLPLYMEADAGLMCSQAEAYGLVTLECMSCARPVIGHATGGTPELIRHEGNGLLYSGGAEPLADAMARFVTDRAFAGRLGENAWQTVKDRFKLEDSVQQTFAILEAAVRRGTASLDSRIGPLAKSSAIQN